jgi:hypothetical protein
MIRLIIMKLALEFPNFAVCKLLNVVPLSPSKELCMSYIFANWCFSNHNS